MYGPGILLAMGANGCVLDSVVVNLLCSSDPVQGSGLTNETVVVSWTAYCYWADVGLG